ncbi:MAG TPA: DUF262 domain-containing protein [Flavobacterium sp.]|nr:DUF262 domain-containing protein [Flavobacterium sp.]
MSQKVELQTKTLGELFKSKVEGNQFEGNLLIPDYQRIYCWEEKNVFKLLDDISTFTNKPYHLGCIILHRNKVENGVYLLNIVDGQQRLVTLTLILKTLGEESPLLNASFESSVAQHFIGYNQYLINNYIANNSIDVGNLLKNIQFSVLVIDSENLDLAYTFFSNQNSRGKALTDYELLKAHHLRFVHIEAQAIHLADRWDNLLNSSGDEIIDKKINHTFGTYLFRLRKWMRKRVWSEDEKFKVKTEFEAAVTIDDIPPFGEQFKFNESIQGGSHFFAYAEHFVFQYKVFSQTQEIIILRKHLSYETNWWYRDVIESLLFAYYLKFGIIYLSDALVCIIKIISQHRYGLGRSSLRGLLQYAGDAEIVFMIEQATSPTFFLAEAINTIKKTPKPQGLTGIRQRYSNCELNIHNELNRSIAIEKLKTL